ncbi:tyrosine-type recombinase/integrase [Mycobacterium riyadhense]|uniref:tyrosine-type recombinase/integrase n=1 Tax=Mycobacterium riyadhense TaxID=486698 RepID=UPI00195E6D42|nr:tyrosine-type recombinase/integrase [Mycobacterium riyadhense]
MTPLLSISGPGTPGFGAGHLGRLDKPIIEICRHYGVVPWRLTPRQVDSYFAGAGKRARSTVRRKMTLIDHYFAFLEQRYAGEITRRYGAAVDSPIDPFNRPKHRGDYGLRIPPSHRAIREFFGRWRESLPEARKPVVARRDYVMGKLTYISGVRAAELCGVRIGDVHWESGQWAGSWCTARELADPGPGSVRPICSTRVGRCCGGTWKKSAPSSATIRTTPKRRCSVRTDPAGCLGVERRDAGHRGDTVDISALSQACRPPFLTGPVTELHPHLLRHACATHNYERGMSLWEVQKLLGHDRPTTTVSYLATAHADPETASLAAAGGRCNDSSWTRGACDEVEPALGCGQTGHLAAQRPARRIR